MHCYNSINLQFKFVRISLHEIQMGQRYKFRCERMFKQGPQTSYKQCTELLSLILLLMIFPWLPFSPGKFPEEKLVGTSSHFEDSTQGKHHVTRPSQESAQSHYGSILIMSLSFHLWQQKLGVDDNTIPQPIGLDPVDYSAVTKLTYGQDSGLHLSASIYFKDLVQPAL